MDILQYITCAISLCSVIIAYSIYRINMHRHITESLFKVVDRLESQAKRDMKRFIYGLDRDNFASWDATTVKKVDEWGAELDLISLLLLAQEIDEYAFFAMYGDVFIRSVYQITPYANNQRQIRGQQFLQPFGNLMPRLLIMWRKYFKHLEYPKEIGLPGHPNIYLSWSLLSNDDACRKFREETLFAKSWFRRLKIFRRFSLFQ